MPKDSRPNLKKLLKRWQKMLRLRDWEVRISWNSDKFINEPGIQARVFQADYHRRAEIFINETLPIDAKRIECAVVHELLHLMVAPFCGTTEDGSASRFAEEVIVGSIAEALTGYRNLDDSWVRTEDKEKNDG